jgi:hypothetical protein
MKQVWFCEECRTVGSVDTRDSDIHSMILKIDQSHACLSPQCRAFVAAIRCINSHMITSRSSLECADIPSWVVAGAAKLLGFTSTDDAPPIHRTRLDEELSSILGSLGVEMEWQTGEEHQP